MKRMPTCLMSSFIQSGFTQSSIDPNNIDNLTSDVPTPLTELDITQYEAYNILASLDVTKATGIDGIGPRILKNCALSLCFPLHLLFKKCLKQCVIPTEWATHIIIPVFKSGEKNLVNNYRPISLLCNVSNVLEKLMYHFHTSDQRKVSAYISHIALTQNVNEIYALRVYLVTHCLNEIYALHISR